MKAVIIFVLAVSFSCSPQRMVETHLFFGQSKPSGDTITKEEWNNFKENYISRVFKEGSTVVSVSGNWFDPESGKLITEPTYQVIYFYKRSSDISRKIDSLRYWYKTLYMQQSVLRVDKKVNASF